MNNKMGANKSPHVTHNSGQNEWYTPPQFIAVARGVMGGIDLDPASSDAAQEIVRAREYYTKDNNGLSKKWFGRVWMNPPYSRKLIGKFAAKLCEEINSGNISQSIVLVNNATETQWFANLVSVSDAIVFTRGRVIFLNQNMEPAGAPLQGQAIIYHGNNSDTFIGEFSRFGWGCLLVANNKQAHAANLDGLPMFENC